jgi:hypothetical protein
MGEVTHGEGRADSHAGCAVAAGSGRTATAGGTVEVVPSAVTGGLSPAVGQPPRNGWWPCPSGWGHHPYQPWKNIPARLLTRCRRSGRVVLVRQSKEHTMTSETAITPARQTVPTTREIEAALASIPMGKGEPGLNTAVLDAAEHAKAAAQGVGGSSSSRSEARPPRPRSRQPCSPPSQPQTRSGTALGISWPMWRPSVHR